MRKPVAKDEQDFVTNWNLTAGNPFGIQTSYGFHEGVDINMNGGGNIELGQPIYAIADGEVTSIHDHTTGFGKHIHYLIKGAWGEKFVHDAHCQEILVKIGDQVKEGQIIAKIGNTGTTYAHDHHAIKKKAAGIDNVANTLEELNEFWEDPIAFNNKWVNQPIEMISKEKYDTDIASRDNQIKERDEEIILIQAELANVQERLRKMEVELKDIEDQISQKNGKIKELEKKLAECEDKPSKEIIIEKPIEAKIDIIEFIKRIFKL